MDCFEVIVDGVGAGMIFPHPNAHVNGMLEWWDYLAASSTTDGAVLVGTNLGVAWLSPNGQITLGQAAPDSHSGCDHEPVDVGFQFSKIVCKKCNKVLP